MTTGGLTYLSTANLDPGKDMDPAKGRRSVSMRRDVFDRLAAYCSENDTAKSHLIEALLEEFFLSARKDLIRQCAQHVYEKRAKKDD